jgi:hypothetical protein
MTPLSNVNQFVVEEVKKVIMVDTVEVTYEDRIIKNPVEKIVWKGNCFICHDGNIAFLCYHTLNMLTG